MEFARFMFALVISLTVHEFAHAKAAQLAGDDTAKRAGRVSLNPLDHLDPMGTLMMIMASLSGIGIGWAKPVPVNVLNMRHPRWDNIKVSLWGPLSNLCLAFAFGMLMRVMIRMAPAALLPWSDLILDCIIVNVSLAVFNLVPVAPLDGSHILSGLLPVEQARQYDRFMGQFGFLILLAIIFVRPEILGMIIGPPIIFFLRLFVG
jgi:Zn-dependent protease